MLVRRKFIQGSTLVALSPLTIACGGGDDDGGGGNGNAACDGAGATTSAAFGHTHFVCVGNSALANPSASADFETTNVDGHTHDVMLSAAQLMEIAGGGTVSVTTSNVQGHTHAVSLSKNG